jgi:hypothetical protein
MQVSASTNGVAFATYFNLNTTKLLNETGERRQNTGVAESE